MTARMIIEVDSSCPANEIIKTEINGEPGIKVVEKEDYKYLTAIPFWDDGSYAPICSKDLKEWVLCFGAKRDGVVIDLLAFASVCRFCDKNRGGAMNESDRDDKDA